MNDPKPDTLITTYLEMTAPSDFIPASSDHPLMRIERLQAVDIDFYLFLYQGVGAALAWRDRVLMPREELHDALSRAQVYVMSVRGIPAGYIELERQGDDVEIAYFGLRPAYQGLGLGKHLLSYGIEQAWEMAPQRVYLHTCNLDGEHAMSNYLKRGFKVYKQHEEPMPQRYV